MLTGVGPAGPPLLARHDPRLRAVVTGRTPLRYAAGAAPALDRPAHVRAASAIVAAPRGHLVIQDDALFLAELVAGEVRAHPLPAPDGVRLFDEGRGNKAAKPDLEAACAWPAAPGPRLLGFGSGSSPRRERVLLADLAGLAPPRLVEAPELYALLRAALPAGAELNVEGALRTAAGHLRLLQRGNGLGGVDAALDVDAPWVEALIAPDGAARPAPRLVAARRWDLGALDGVRLGFTDGAALDGPRWLFAAAAEASPDAYGDGPVTGSVVGWADEAGGAWAPLTDPAGGPVVVKLEGLCRLGPGELLGVVDADDPERESELLHLRLDGPWPGQAGGACGGGSGERGRPVGGGQGPA